MKEKARKGTPRPARSIKISGIYYDHQEPRHAFVPVPSVRMRGYWMHDAGIHAGDTVDVVIRAGCISLRARKA